MGWVGARLAPLFPSSLAQNVKPLGPAAETPQRPRVRRPCSTTPIQKKQQAQGSFWEGGGYGEGAEAAKRRSDSPLSPCCVWCMRRDQRSPASRNAGSPHARALGSDGTLVRPPRHSRDDASLGGIRVVSSFHCLARAALGPEWRGRIWLPLHMLVGICPATTEISVRAQSSKQRGNPVKCREASVSEQRKKLAFAFAKNV